MKRNEKIEMKNEMKRISEYTCRKWRKAKACRAKWRAVWAGEEKKKLEAAAIEKAEREKAMAPWKKKKRNVEMAIWSWLLSHELSEMQSLNPVWPFRGWRRESEKCEISDSEKMK